MLSGKSFYILLGPIARYLGVRLVSSPSPSVVAFDTATKGGIVGVLFFEWVIVGLVTEG